MWWSFVAAIAETKVSGVTPLACSLTACENRFHSPMLDLAQQMIVLTS